MRRYIDLVIIPNYHKLTMQDVVLLPKLSAHLRAQLNTELMGQHLVVHPFFKKLAEINQAVMNHICNHAIENMSYARGDVAFTAGVMAKSMLLVTSGVLDYIPIKDKEEHHVPKKMWCCEAVLWTKWTHQGQLQASIESTAIQINAAKFRAGLQENGFVMNYVRTYGLAFCDNLSRLWDQAGMPTDLHDQAALDIDISQFKQGNFVWFGGMNASPRPATGGLIALGK